VTWRIVFTKQARRDARLIAGAGLRKQVERLLVTIARNPFQTPPYYEKLVGDLRGMYSRRINITHRLIYQVCEEEKTVKVIRMWTHYE